MLGWHSVVAGFGAWANGRHFFVGPNLLGIRPRTFAGYFHNHP